MIDELQDFFRDKAFAYTHGQMRYLSLLFHVPSEIRVGRQVIKIGKSADVEEIFSAYRENLISQGYTKTVAKLLHKEPGQNDTISCLVTYSNLGNSGQTISTEHAHYVLIRTEDGFLRIALTEFVDEPRDDLFAGVEDKLISLDTAVR